MSSLKEEIVLNIEEIIKILPHRYPMLLVDRILEIGEDSVTGLKNVTVNEDFFNGHFPVEKVMPGVLIIESIAQTAAVFAMKLYPELKSVYFMSIKEAKFRKKVVPGDTLIHKLQTIKRKSKTWVFKGQSYVDGALVCEVEIMAMLVE